VNINIHSSAPDHDAGKTRQQLFSQELRVLKGVSAKDSNRDFWPLNLRSIVPGLRLPFTLYLKTLDQQNKQIRYLPFGEESDIFSEELIAKLQGLKLDRFYFRKENIDQAITYLNDCLTIVALDDNGTALQKLKLLYDHLHLSLLAACTLSPHSPKLNSVFRQVEWVLTELQQTELPFHLLWEILLREYSIYYHSINVMLISLGFMLFLQQDSTACNIMGISALFHDVGMLKVPEDLLQKSGGLAPAESVEIQHHPQWSFEMLQHYPACPQESLRLVLEHHENADGSGYPQHLYLSKQHPHTRILRLVDAYEALTAPRPYMPAQTTFTALQSIKNQIGPHGHVFDQALLIEFIQFIAS
jgi:HD-GYP domain-containing protein (c-di-GMP phosphodiesterase class II)